MLENLELFRMRAGAADNDRQHNRMIMDRLRGFHRALLYSYQAAWIRKDKDGAEWVRALMNPDKVKFDYDEKIVSVEWEYGFSTGDTFEWGKDTGSHWIILKPEDTELSYLRASVRRCKQLIATDPETNESYSQWCAIRGPVETKINTIQKAGIVADVPNMTLDIYMADTPENRRAFKRYCNFEFEGLFWKVQTFDYISTPGVLEIVAEEDYDCKHGELIVEVNDPNPQKEEEENDILGPTFVKPTQAAIYTYKFDIQNAEWSISLPAERNKEVDDVIDYTIDGDTIKVTWVAMISGSYIIHYGDMEKTIIVESLF